MQFFLFRFPLATITLANAKHVMREVKKTVQAVEIPPSNFMELCQGFARRDDIYKGTVKIETDRSCLILATDQMINHMKEITEIFISFDMEVRSHL